jgi:Ca-activated chloride channel family protein
VAAKIRDAIREEYILEHRSSDKKRDDKWRKVKVQLEPPPGCLRSRCALATATMRLSSAQLACALGALLLLPCVGFSQATAAPVAGSAAPGQGAALGQVAALGQGAALGQVQTSPQTSSQAPDENAPATPQANLQALRVSHDPVVSPDAADNAGVKPVSGNEATPAAAAGALAGGPGHYTLRQNVQEVDLNVTVLNDHGELVNNLTQGDFRVLEDNVPQTITHFDHADTPVSMGILVDNSGSMREKRGAVNEAALDLVRASNRDDEAFIVNFSDEAFIDQDFTSNLTKLQEGLAHYDARGGTALYDATVASADELSKHAKHAKQVLLIITDGEDNASGLTLEQTIRRVQDLHGPIVYCIGLLFGDSGHEERDAKRALQLMAEETGGIAYFPRSLDEVDPIAAEVARDIRSQYLIGYNPTKPESEGGYRTIKVLAHEPGSHKDLNVRTRSGYYPKPSGDNSDPAISTGSN